MKNIMVIASNYPINSTSSYGWFVHEICKRLTNKGFNVVVLSPHCYGSKFTESFDGVNVLRFPYFFPFSSQKLAYGDGIPYNIKKNILAKIQVPLFVLSEFVSALIHVKKEKIDLINTHWLLPQGLIGAICHKLFGIPHVTTVHGSDINTIKKSKILRRICVFIIKNSNWITTNSNYTKELILSIDPSAGEKVSIVPIGVDINFLQQGRILQEMHQKDSKILSVGRLVESKGVDVLILAMKEVVIKFPDVKLFIVGDGPERNKLETLVENLNLNENVVFVGSVEHSLLPSLYASSDIFVLPSQNIGGIVEGLGVVLLEAMACGTPVIGSDIGGIKDIIIDGYNGFLVPEKSPGELSTKIIELLSDSEIAIKFTYNGFNTIKNKFSWDRVIDDFSTIYYDCVNIYDV
ncbi:glycosyltransferase family 4 protein [Methanosarcina sp. KYL-1]|uniref:glycosyltransferase family 4 protein n=1 Tax=Methanosarcina sp. KYL-1 TaxID=2602068 RepID=UPI0021018899|nr:glycosyltransferase family 4 protein [Methanosarcina sp. KYL-1]MCQ1535092.1 glycosyltransferase family 4 protein [Methanosarcina sp. KYL-1]